MLGYAADRRRKRHRAVAVKGRIRQKQLRANVFGRHPVGQGRANDSPPPRLGGSGKCVVLSPNSVLGTTFHYVVRTNPPSPRCNRLASIKPVDDDRKASAGTFCTTARTPYSAIRFEWYKCPNVRGECKKTPRRSTRIVQEI